MITKPKRTGRAANSAMQFALRPAVLLCMLAMNSAYPQPADQPGSNAPGAMNLSLTQDFSGTKPAAATGTESAQTPQADAAALPGGPLQVLDNPSTSELEARAKYWEEHGRSDLAANIRSRLPRPAPQAAPVPSMTATNPAPQYANAPAPAVANTLSSTTLGTPAPRNLNQEAHYWETHGRPDLAGQIRQKLQTEAPGQPVVVATPVPYATHPADGAQPATQPALENRLLREPGNQGTRLDLVQIYRSTGELGKARAQVDSVLAASPDLPAALFASAQLYADQRMWRETLDTLEKIQPGSRTPEMAHLQKMAWAHVQLDRADALVREGRNTEAEILLHEVALELAITPSRKELAAPPALWKSVPAPTGGKRKQRQ